MRLRSTSLKKDKTEQCDDERAHVLLDQSARTDWSGKLTGKRSIQKSPRLCRGTELKKIAHGIAVGFGVALHVRIRPEEAHHQCAPPISEHASSSFCSR